jgi:hypothetical protein
MCSRSVFRESRWYAADVVDSLDGAGRLGVPSETNLGPASR